MAEGCLIRVLIVKGQSIPVGVKKCVRAIVVLVRRVKIIIRGADSVRIQWSRCPHSYRFMVLRTKTV